MSAEMEGFYTNFSAVTDINAAKGEHIWAPNVQYSRINFLFKLNLGQNECQK